MLHRKLLPHALALIGLAAFLHGGCTITFDPPDGGTTEKVTIRIMNNTSADLDPELYITSQVLPRTDFFKAANKYTDFGVFDQGLMGPFSQETFVVNCSAARQVGTTGGSFKSGQDLVRADREIILTQETVFMCGEVITFTYSRTSSGYTVGFKLD